MHGNFFSRTRRSGALCAIGVLAVSVAVAKPALAGTTSTTATPAISNGAFGVTIDSAGWIHYPNTLASPTYLSNMHTAVVTGVKKSDGTCLFSGSVSTGALYYEETTYNPKTCQRTVVTGKETAAGLAKLAAIAAKQPPLPPPTPVPTPPPNPALAAAGPSTPAPSIPPTSMHLVTPAPGTVSPNYRWTGYGGQPTYSMYNKISYVDPLDITITAEWNNLGEWRSGSMVSGQTVYPGALGAEAMIGLEYKYNVDNWSASPQTYSFHDDVWKLQSTPPYTFDSQTTGTVSQTFYNTDFETVVIAITGLAGYAACGFDSSPATFYLSPSITINGWGFYSTSWSDSVKGGCSDLVHFRHNSQDQGYGTNGFIGLSPKWPQFWILP